MNTGDELSIPEIIASLVQLRDQAVLDIGCGEGRLTRWLASQGASSAVGLECGREMLVQARAATQAAESHGVVEIVEGFGQDLPLPDHQFDVAIFAKSLHHVPKEHQGAALQQAQRVTKPGGSVLIFEPIGKGANQDLLRPVHDETIVRDSAQSELEGAINRGLFRRKQRLEVLTISRHASYQAFAERLVRISPEIAISLEKHEATMREGFERFGEQTENGWAFPQPLLVDHLERI